MRSLKKSKSKRNYRQMGGDGQGPRGNGNSFPIEYFGGNSGRYYELGSPELVPESSFFSPFGTCSVVGSRFDRKNGV